jgi:alpha-galactosidase
MKKKIVLLGAGSSVFGPSMFSDLYLSQVLDGSTITLCDINETKLQMIYDLLSHENEKTGNKFILEQTTDRKEAFQNADFVISSVEAKRFHFRWQDHKVPLKHGARTLMGECGGPGGFFHSARVIPLVLSIVEDISNICPNAFFINFSNPVARISLAIHRKYPKIKFIGLCHQIEFLNYHLPKMFDKPLGDLKMTVAGLNHFGFLIGLEDFKSGENLLPAFNAKSLQYFDGKWDRFQFDEFTFEIYKRFGYFPHSGDNHLCEYIQFADEFVKLEDLKDWIQTMEEFGKMEDKRIIRFHKKLKKGKPSKRSVLSSKLSGESAIPVIEAIITNQRTYLSSVNIPNEGIIENLPSDLIVEGPAWVDGSGVHGVKLGSLPKNIAALLRMEASIQDVCVEAILHESKTLALACLAMDLKVEGFKMAENIFDELFALQREYLPDFR